MKRVFGMALALCLSPALCLQLAWLRVPTKRRLLMQKMSRPYSTRTV